MRQAFLPLVLLLVLVCAIGAPSGRYLDLKKVYLERSTFDSTKRALRVDFRYEAQCSWGDLDAMLLDGEASKGALKFQLSLEPINSVSTDSPVIVGEPLGPPGPLPRQFSFDLPEFESPTVLGLFICTTPAKGSGTHSCRGQQLKSYDSLIAPYKVNPTANIQEDGSIGPAKLIQRTRPLTTGSTYFFQYIIAHRTHVEFTDSAMTAAKFDQLEQKLVDREADVTSIAALRQTLEQFGETLGSRALARSSSGIEVTLPYYRPKKCR